MNIILRSLFVLVFTTSIYAGHHEGGNHMHGNTAEWEINAYTSAAPSTFTEHISLVFGYEIISAFITSSRGVSI